MLDAVQATDEQLIVPTCLMRISAHTTFWIQTICWQVKHWLLSRFIFLVTCMVFNSWQVLVGKILHWLTVFYVQSHHLHKKITHISVAHTDLKPLIYTHIHSEWQQGWDSQPCNKLHKIYPNVHHMAPLSSRFSRRDHVYNSLRIRHSYPTHSYLLHKDPQPLCIPATLHFRWSIFSPNVLTSSPFELIITLIQIYFNFFTRFIPLLYYSIWKISVCVRSYTSYWR